MTATKADIVAQLQKEILALQGYKKNGINTAVDRLLGPIKQSFPSKEFPLGAVHEFVVQGSEAAAATSGFIAGLLAHLMITGGPCLWISANRNIFPPALKAFGIEPEKIIFIDLHKESQISWVMEEGLKCKGLSAVVAEIGEMSFVTSRRLQLAVEQSEVTGFLLRHNPRNLATTACVTRWQIKSSPAYISGNMPGVGFPCWEVNLLKVRNGKPGTWKLQYAGNSFKFLSKTPVIIPLQQKKTG